MKKLPFVAGAAFVLFTAAANAQTDTVPTAQPQQQPVTNQPVATQQPVSKDKYNNWTTDTYKMQPMPEALTTEKIFPVIGKYQLTDKEGAQSTVTVSLDPTNKGIIWVEGLPQGKIKATLRKSPATYKIPVQKLEEEATTTEMPVAEETTANTKTAKTSKTAKKEKAPKELAEGVLIYDKDANVLNVCIGCSFNNEDPAVAFNTTEEQPVVEEKVEKSANKTKKKTTTKVAKVKPVHYTGNKLIEQTAATSTETQQQQ